MSVRVIICVDRAYLGDHSMLTRLILSAGALVVVGMDKIPPAPKFNEAAMIKEAILKQPVEELPDSTCPPHEWGQRKHRRAAR